MPRCVEGGQEAQWLFHSWVNFEYSDVDIIDLVSISHCALEHPGGTGGMDGERRVRGGEGFQKLENFNSPLPKKKHF